jgi:peptidoglycan/xylan/chitin deacetylase (PgdA/CDA1 family)
MTAETPASVPRIPWPDGIRCPVVLAFHVDAESLFIATDPDNATRPITVSQGTYGPRLGVPRILRLLREHEIKTTFFVPGITAERHPYAVEAIVADGHEIGHHGYTHRRPDSLSLTEEDEELGRGLEVLRRLSGQEIRGYASPSWEYSTNTIALLQKHGFSYACDAMDEDVPYYVHVDDSPTDLVELPVSWTLDDGPLYWFGLLPPLHMGGPYAEPSRVFELWSSEFDSLYEEGAYFQLTMHPFLTGRAVRIKNLGRLIEHIETFPGAAFRTAGEVAAMYRAEVTPEQGKPGAWWPAAGSVAPTPRRVDGVPLLG